VELFAHSENASGRRQPLDEHLHNVAELAARFGRKFGAGEFARLVGLCHDVGKSTPPRRCVRSSHLKLQAVSFLIPFTVFTGGKACAAMT